MATISSSRPRRSIRGLKAVFLGFLTLCLLVVTLAVSGSSASAQATSAVSGVVRNADQTPAANVWVNLYSSTEQRQRTEWLGGQLTDGSGNYSFSVDAGCYTAIAVAPFGSEFDAYGSGKNYDEKFGCSGATTGFSSTLYQRPTPSDGSISGLVQFDDGAAAPDVTVDLFNLGASGGRGSYISSATSDSSGRYSFNVSSGCYIAVTIAPDGTSFGSVGSGIRFDQETACSPGPYGFSATLFRPVVSTPLPFIERLFVGPNLADCVGLVPRQCLQVSRTADGPKTNFFDTIQDFNRVDGRSYELLVEVTPRVNPPADASQFIYRLIEIVAQSSGPGPVPATTCRPDSAVIGRVTFAFSSAPVGTEALRDGLVIRTGLSGDGTFTDSPPPGGDYTYSLRFGDNNTTECGGFSVGAVSSPSCSAFAAVTGRVTFTYSNLNPGSRVLRNGIVILTDLSGDGTFTDSPPADGDYLYQIQYDALPSEVQFVNAIEECGSFSVGPVSNPSCAPDSAVIGRVTFRYTNLNPGSRVIRNGEVILTDISGDGTFTDSPPPGGNYFYQIQYDSLPSEVPFGNATEDCGSFSVGGASNPSCSADGAVIGRVTFRFSNANPDTRVLRNGAVILTGLSGNGTFTDSPPAGGNYNYQLQYDALPSEVQFQNATVDCGSFSVGASSNVSCGSPSAVPGTVTFQFANVNPGSRILRNGAVLFNNVSGTGSFSDSPGLAGEYTYQIQYDALPSEVQFVNAIEDCGSFTVT